LTVDKLGTANAARALAMAGLLDEVRIYTRVLSDAEIASLAARHCVRGAASQVLDGDFSGAFPSGNGTEGGDFISTFAIVAPPVSAPAVDDDDDDHGCGMLGIEGPIIWAAFLLFRRRRNGQRPNAHWEG
jgi:hypothetical protein